MQSGDLKENIILALEEELKYIINQSGRVGLNEFRHMLAYHLGWEGEGAGPNATGKRIRPLLLLLVTASSGGKWQNALPAAASVELVHNFSLIHDDIQDSSPTRHGRLAIWKKWGIPLAINAGDAMFALAHISLLRLSETTNHQTAIKAADILHNTCLRLTQGQYLDMTYENQQNITPDDYWQMVNGKTAALFSASTLIGALVAVVDDAVSDIFCKYGYNLGLAFQVVDDYLGIWGNEALTGKSSKSDLVSGKKSLPVIYGLGQNGVFARQWRRGGVETSKVKALATQLEEEGGRQFTLEQAKRFTQRAMDSLIEAKPFGEAAKILREITESLLLRES